MTLVEKKLVARARTGDHLAFNALVANCYLRLKNSILKMTKCPHDSDDILQDALIKAFRNIDKFEGKSSFYSWLYRIAHNTLKDNWQMQKRRPPSQDMDIDESYLHDQHQYLQDCQTPEEYLILEQTGDEINQVYEKMPAELQAVLQLRELGFDYKKIAQKFKVPIGTIRSRLNRAKGYFIKLTGTS